MKAKDLKQVEEAFSKAIQPLKDDHEKFGKKICDIDSNVEQILYLQNLKTRSYVLLGISTFVGLAIAIISFMFSSLITAIVGIGIIVTSLAGIVELRFYGR